MEGVLGLNHFDIKMFRRKVRLSIGVALITVNIGSKPEAEGVRAVSLASAGKQLAHISASRVSGQVERR